MTKPKLFEPLNAPVSSSVPNSWKSLINQLEDDLQLAVKQSDPTLISDTLFRMSDLHWFIRLAWDRSHKIPLPCSLEPLFKARGKLLQSIASLAKECHFRAVPESLSHSNSVDWISGVLFEGVLWCAEGESKTEAIKATQGHNKNLRNYENPYSQEKHPHTWNLIEASIKWAESRSAPVAFQVLWQNFLQNKSQETRALESPYFIPVMQGKEGGTYTFLSPKSRERVLLSKAMLKNCAQYEPLNSANFNTGKLKLLLGKA